MLIFDFDGTIANTEDWHFKAWNDALRRYDVELKEEDFLRYIGKKDEVIMPMVEKDFCISIKNYDDFMSYRVECFIKKYLPNIKPYPYFVDIYKSGVDFCIVSNQNEEVIKKFFEYNGLDMPKIYSASNLGISKENLIKEISDNYKEVTVYEDVNDYLKYANSLGCKTVGIEYKYNIGTLVDADELIKY